MESDSGSPWSGPPQPQLETQAAAEHRPRAAWIAWVAAVAVVALALGGFFVARAITGKSSNANAATGNNATNSGSNNGQNADTRAAQNLTNGGGALTGGSSGIGGLGR